MRRASDVVCLAIGLDDFCDGGHDECGSAKYLKALREAAGYLRIWLGIDRSWIGPRCCPHRSALLRRSELGVQAVVGRLAADGRECR